MRKRRLLAALATAAVFTIGAAPGGIEIVVEVPGPPGDGAPQPAPDPVPAPPGADPQPEPDAPLPRTGAPVARLLTVAATAVLAGAIALKLSARPRPPQGEMT